MKDRITSYNVCYTKLLRGLVVQRPTLLEQPVMSELALAVIESVEEAIFNSLLMAHTVVGRDGNTRYSYNFV